jgi:hypothetical protein
MSGRVIFHAIASVVNHAFVAKFIFRVKYAIALGILVKLIGNFRAA